MRSAAVLTWDVPALAQALKLPADQVRGYFTDGRRISYLFEARIASEVLGGVPSPSEGSDYDVLDTAGGRWEVRCITRRGMFFCPSHMVGSGRRFQQQGFIDKLCAVDGYALADVECFPAVPVWLVESEVIYQWWERGLLGQSTKVTRSILLSLLN